MTIYRELFGPKLPHGDSDDATRRLAREIIDQAIGDIVALRKLNMRNVGALVVDAKDAFDWINERSDRAFGYGWALHHGSRNPNRIRLAVKVVFEEVFEEKGHLIPDEYVAHFMSRLKCVRTPPRVERRRRRKQIVSVTV
jgi:hypothetical protein